MHCPQSQESFPMAPDPDFQAEQQQQPLAGVDHPVGNSDSRPETVIEKGRLTAICGLRV